MIHFSRLGKQVRAALEYKSGDIDTKINFYWECGSEVTAESLSIQLQALIDKTVEREIKTAYESGYRAGRSKKTKRTWFHCFLTHINKELPEWKKQ